MPRAPPSDRDRLAALADRDVASSNTTLNALLGRQKAWMVGHHGEPVRPTPRSPAAVLQKSTAAPVLPSPAPSDEPSPVMSHTQDSPTIDPSSLEFRPRIPVSYILDATQLPSVVANQRPSNQDRRYNAPVNQPTTGIEYGRANGAQSQAQASREPLAQLRNEIQTHAPSPQESQSHPSPDLSGTFHQQSRNTPSQRPSPIVPSSQSTFHNQQPMISPTVRSPPIPQGQGQRPPSTIWERTSSNNPSNVQRASGRLVSLRSWLPLIEAHLQSISNSDLNQTLEGPRLVLLKDACKEEDMFYVALHQVFCIWSLKRGDFPVISGLPSAVSLQAAFTTIGTFLRTNDGLRNSELKWFSEFPSPLEDLIRTSEPYRQTVANVGAFLIKLGSEFHLLEKRCSQRGYPPLVNELVERLGLPSTVLQAVVSRFIRRNLGFADDEIGFKVQQIFEQDKMIHYELSARVYTDRPPTEKEIRQHQANITAQYLMLNEQRLSRRNSSTALAGSPGLHPSTPTLPSNGYFQQVERTSGSQEAPESNTSAFGQQNSAVQMQNLPRLAHQMQPTLLSTGSPNLSTHSIVMTSPNMNGQQIYVNAASPTVTQGQNVNSPVQAGVQWASPVVRSNNSPLVQNASLYQVAAAPHANQRNQIVVENLRHQQRQQQQQQRQQPQQVYHFQQHMGSPLPQQTQLQQQVNNQQQGAQQQFLHLHQLAAQQQNQFQLQQQAMSQRQAMQNQQNQLQLSQQAAQQQQRIINQQNWLQQQTLPQQRALTQQPQNMNNVQEHHIRQQVLALNRAHAQQQGGVRNSLANPGSQSHSRNNIISTNARPMTTNPRNSPAVGTFSVQRMNQLSVSSGYSNLTPGQHAALPPLQRPLVPPENFIHQVQHPNPDATALHQAHLRSPRLVISDSPAEVAEDDLPRRFYQSVKEFAIKPVKLATVAVTSFSFTLSEAQWALMATDKIIGTQVKRTITRTFKCGTLQYRLRCIRSVPDSTICLPKDWVVSDTAWPQTIFVEINGHPLEIRRKILHGKDLPIDVTRYIKDPMSNGANVVKISVPRLRKAVLDGTYFFAVEVIEALDHKRIMNMCFQDQRIPASQTLGAIKKSLAGPSNSDDEISMVASDLSIDLADPFTARIFETPVRGNSCLHRECFDLETFLMTRNSKPKGVNQPCMVDVWKCPLCGHDARPYSLRIDDFLMSIRSELAKQDNLDVKAILIAADGTWKPKPEPESRKRKLREDGGDSSDSEDDQPVKKNVALAKEKKQEPEVIDLDSD